MVSSAAMDWNEWNRKIIEEFRANDGQVGGDFAGMPMVLLHHKGRKSGRDFVVPLAYQADEDDPRTIYIFASKAGAPSDPDWFRNLSAVDRTTVERGAETYEVRIREVTGPDRDRIYAEQARRIASFAEYEEKTAGIRTIPVVALERVS
jgi:deazaflavin-dependent oxidoreductase (nitroreductase family)